MKSNLILEEKQGNEGVLSRCKEAECSTSTPNLALHSERLREGMKRESRKSHRNKEHRSEKLKKRPNLIEDYFYPETISACLDPLDHAPVVQSKNEESLSFLPSKPKANDLEGTMALKEVSNNNSTSFLNCSIIKTIKKIIKADIADITNFENWDRETETSYTENVMNDIKRSRIRDSEDKDYILEDLLLIIIFYCENNTICYQQGMQDIFIPFVYLKTAEFSLAEVYGYSKGYIDMFMPNTLHSKFTGTDYSLPHLQCQLSLLKMMLKYHDIELHNHFRNLDCEIEAFATPWILTQFSRVVDFTLIYELIEIILFENDQLMALYMSVALLLSFKNEILECDAIEMLLPLLQKRAKVLNAKELCELYYKSVAIRSQTPLSLAILIHKLKINDHAAVISYEEMNELQTFELDIFVMYPEEVLCNQNKISNCSHLYNTTNNDKTWNKFHLESCQNKYVTGDEQNQCAKELSSITSINVLKRDCSNDTEIGKHVALKYIDITNKKKTKQIFKDCLQIFGVKKQTPEDILREISHDLKKYNILILTSNHKEKLDSSERKRLEQTLEICSSLGISRVCVMKGGMKGYLKAQ